MRIEHPGLIIGSRKIATFLHISRATLYRWIKRYGFNVVHLPDGRLAYTPELLHVWLLARQRVARQATEAQTDGEEKETRAGGGTAASGDEPDDHGEGEAGRGVDPDSVTDE